MGLDMYVYAEKFISTSTNSQHFETVRKIFPKEIVDNPTHAFVTMEVISWRKVNAVHRWFVENYANGIDECRRMYVFFKDLLRLKEVCQQVIDDPDRAPELLPTMDGFFFGSTEYDDYYFDDLHYTVSCIKRIEQCSEEELDSLSFYYQASW